MKEKFGSFDFSALGRAQEAKKEKMKIEQFLSECARRKWMFTVTWVNRKLREMFK